MRGPFGGRPKTECSIPRLAGGGALSHVRAGQRPAAFTRDPCAGPAAGLPARRRPPPAGHVARLRTGRDAPSVPRSHRSCHPGDRTHRPGPPTRCQHRHPDLVDLDRHPRTSAGPHPRTRPPPGRHQPADLVRTVPATLDPKQCPSRASRHRPRRPGRSPQLSGSIHPRHRHTHRAQLPRRQPRQTLTDEPRHRERNQPTLPDRRPAPPLARRHTPPPGG